MSGNDSSTGQNRSPIKNLPVRLPGQSSREHLDRHFENKMLAPILLATFAVCHAVLEWYRKLANTPPSPPSPWSATVVAVVVVLSVAWYVRKAYVKARQYGQGILGEEAVGQYLEEHLRPQGCQVLHDIPAEGFNVDHVVVGPTGVFAIETKTHRKPAKGASRVKFDGTSVSVNGFRPDRDPVVQAKAQARWLFDLLERSTGRRVFVQPIVIYPGWFVESQPGSGDVWVLNEKALPTFIANARGARLTNEDVHLLAYHLAKYVISKGR